MVTSDGSAPPTPNAAGRTDGVARALGYLSLALAGPPLAAPRAFCAALAVGAGARQQWTARAVGARELAAAAGLLTRPGPAWLWVRVGGDAMDLAVLGRALRHHDRHVVRRTVGATAAVGAITALDVYAAVSRSRRGTTMQLSASTTVNLPAAEVYAFWRHLTNLPTFMAHVDAVRTEDGGRSHWTVSAPFGRQVEWDATITEDVADSRLAWQSVQGADVTNRGAVDFRPAPGGRGTEVHVEIAYAMPAGRLGAAVARYFGEEPHQQLDDDLRRLKQVLETGEVVRSEGAPGGKQARGEFPQHAAQPLTARELSRLEQSAPGRPA